jgi:hypothetical protein
MRQLVRRVGGVAAAISIVACAHSGGSASADSARPDSSITAASAGVAAETGRGVTGRARVTGGPQRPPVEPRSSGCGGPAVNVKVAASALDSSSDADATTRAIRAISTDLLAPVRGAVGPPSISPAIRAFRVRITDTSATRRVLARLRSSPKVENVEVDECAVMIGR